MSKLSRRQALKAVAAAGAVTGCLPSSRKQEARARMQDKDKKKTDAVVAVTPQGFPWQTSDPFLFCVHHDDHYPAGNERQGPAASLAGRNLGQDFEGKDGWRMYHGEIVPGFPQHPHRGFETVTVVRRGLLDHSDSMGATARYGRGDVQWLTAGRGIQHAEMFPLVERQRENPVELFQIWLNLPIRDKMADPYFAMLWSHTVPKQIVRDSEGRTTEIVDDGRALRRRARAVAAARVVGVAPGQQRGDLDDQARAARALHAAARRRGRTGRCTSSAATASTSTATRSRTTTASSCAPELDAAVTAGPEETEALLLQGKPIGEPVVHYGPFVMTHAGGDPAGDRRLPAHRLRRLALGQQRPGARPRGGPLRAPPRRQDRTPGLIGSATFAPQRMFRRGPARRAGASSARWRRRARRGPRRRRRTS